MLLSQQIRSTIHTTLPQVGKSFPLAKPEGSRSSRPAQALATLARSDFIFPRPDTLAPRAIAAGAAPRMAESCRRVVLGWSLGQHQVLCDRPQYDPFTYYKGHAS